MGSYREVHHSITNIFKNIIDDLSLCNYFGLHGDEKTKPFPIIQWITKTGKYSI